MIQLVFAHSGLEFGSDNGMPWHHISQDFKNFKSRTTNTSLIMGAKTFASLPGKLKDRTHFVLVDPDRPNPVAKNGDVPDVPITKENLMSILSNAHKYFEDYSVIGGAKLLELALPFADKVIKTSINYSKYFGKPVTAYLSDEFLTDLENWGVLKEYHCYFDQEHGSRIIEEIFIKTDAITLV